MARAVLVGALAALMLVIGLPVATAGQDDYGRTWARDRQLRAGCHNYKYQYKVKSPTDDWALETFLIDPDKSNVGSGQMLAGNDPARGSSTFRLCRNATTPGRFKIRGKLTYNDGFDEYVVWLDPGFFRLRKTS